MRSTLQATARFIAFRECLHDGHAYQGSQKFWLEILIQGLLSKQKPAHKGGTFSPGK